MKKKCPLIKDECLEHGCEFYIHLIGKNPQTGADEDQWGCAVSWLPILLIENAGQVRKATASIDKVATETAGVIGAVKSMNGNFCKAAEAALTIQEQQRLLDADHRISLENKSGPPGE